MAVLFIQKRSNKEAFSTHQAADTFCVIITTLFKLYAPWNDKLLVALALIHVWVLQVQMSFWCTALH